MYSLRRDKGGRTSWYKKKQGKDQKEGDEVTSKVMKAMERENKMEKRDQSESRRKSCRR